MEKCDPQVGRVFTPKYKHCNPKMWGTVTPRFEILRPPYVSHCDPKVWNTVTPPSVRCLDSRVWNNVTQECVALEPLRVGHC